MISKPRCKEGHDAWIIKSLMPENIGKRVTCAQYIGFLEAEQEFVHGPLTMRVPVTSHYWWITSKNGISTPMGETSKALGPDVWLQPIDPDLLDDDEETGDQIYNIRPVTEEIL